MEGERGKHKQLCEEMCFEFTLVKRDTAVLTGLCYSASLDGSACLLSMSMKPTHSCCSFSLCEQEGFNLWITY